MWRPEKNSLCAAQGLKGACAPLNLLLMIFWIPCSVKSSSSMTTQKIHSRNVKEFLRYVKYCSKPRLKGKCVVSIPLLPTSPSSVRVRVTSVFPCPPCSSVLSCEHPVFLLCSWEISGNMIIMSWRSRCRIQAGGIIFALFRDRKDALLIFLSLEPSMVWGVDGYGSEKVFWMAGWLAE